MQTTPAKLLPFAALCGALALSTLTPLPAQAASSAASSVSESLTTSSGSFSESIEGSSNSSSKTKRMAQGDYRVMEVLALADQPDKRRLRLQALADDSAEGEFFLTLPAAALMDTPLETGQIVQAKARVYGLEFAAAASGAPFFLVLEDAWQRELSSRPVVL